MVIDARFLHCQGQELACQTADGGAVAAIDVDLTGDTPIMIEVASLDGGGGDFSLDITLAPATCGDDICQSGEDCASCSFDCGLCGPTCGDGICESAEDCGSCPFDCGACVSRPICGDGACDTGEDCASCSFDCGSCGPTCGDGICDGGEDCESCPFDCGSCISPPDTWLSAPK